MVDVVAALVPSRVGEGKMTWHLVFLVWFLYVLSSVFDKQKM